MKLIGEVYKEKILSLPPEEREKFEIPLNDGATRIENDFFGWKLYYRKLGRKSELFIDCRSEVEAKYIKLFMDLTAREIYIPKNEEYIKQILPELEHIKKQTDEVLNEYLESLMKRAHREKLKFMVYKEVLGEEEIDEL
jgi:hypothetical protein